jgi:hypothetical protein
MLGLSDVPPSPHPTPARPTTQSFLAERVFSFFTCSKRGKIYVFYITMYLYFTDWPSISLVHVQTVAPKNI